MNGMSLLDVLRGVMLDPAEQAVYEADPHAYLEQHGYQDVEDADLSEAFGLVADTLPADQAQAAFTGEIGPDIPTLGGTRQTSTSPLPRSPTSTTPPRPSTTTISTTTSMTPTTVRPTTGSTTPSATGATTT